jgi:hypothetical protein
MKEPCKGEVTIVWEADLQGKRRLLKASIMLESMSSVSKTFLGSAIYKTIIDKEQNESKELAKEALEDAELKNNQASVAALTDDSEPKPAEETKPTEADEVELTDEELDAATSPATSQLELSLKEPSLDDLKAKLQQ